MANMIGVMDCNNFFVSCERLFRPDLEGKPVAVLSSNDGCIVARSNEVKDMGVPMGIPLFQAKQLVDMSPVTLFSSNFTLYRDISRRVMATLAAEVGKCEIYSVDEAFFVTSDLNEAELQHLRTQIMKVTGIPISIGIADTKTIAKAAVEEEKRGSGVCRLTIDRWQSLAATYQCSEVWNIGRATAAALREVGVHTVADLLALERSWVAKRFGVVGCRLYDELSGQAVYSVTANSEHLRQSVASTRSFAKTTTNRTEVERAVAYHVSQVAEKLRSQHLETSRLIILVRASRHGDFAYRKSSTAIDVPVASNDTRVLTAAAMTGVDALYEAGVPYKKVGVTASLITPEQMHQSDLFATTTSAPTSPPPVDTVIDALNRRFGPGVVRSARLVENGPRTSAQLRSPHYTTVWKDIPTITAQ